MSAGVSGSSWTTALAAAATGPGFTRRRHLGVDGLTIRRGVQAIVHSDQEQRTISAFGAKDPIVEETSPCLLCPRPGFVGS